MIIAPPVAPRKGPDTAAWVAAVIRDNPQLHKQKYWVDFRECGTTLCAAGWTAVAHGYSPIQVEKMGGIVATHSHRPVIFEVARRKLGLGIDDARALFHLTNESEALEALDWIALGKKLDWEVIRANADS